MSESDKDHPDHPHGTPPGQDPDFVPPGHGGTPPGQEDTPDNPEDEPHPEHPIADPEAPHPEPHDDTPAAVAVEPTLGLGEFAGVAGLSQAAQAGLRRFLDVHVHRYAASGNYPLATWQEYYEGMREYVPTTR